MAVPTPKAVLDWFAYAAVRFGDMLVRALPPQAMVGLSAVAGAVWWRVDGRRRSRVRENLQVAFPGADRRWREVTGRAVFRNMVRVVAEAALLDRFLPNPRAVRRRCRLVGDWGHLTREAAEGRGGIVGTAHLGSWEVGGRVLAAVVPSARFVVRPIENEHLDRLAVRARGGEDAVIRKKGAVRSILRSVREGHVIGILADQDARSQGAFVPFFGLPASTWRTPATVALRTGVDLYAAACLRRPGTELGFDVHLKRLTPGTGAPEEVETGLLADLTRHLEAWVRIAPDQYNWLHRRWKTRPPGEAATSAVPAYAFRRRGA